MKTTMVSLKVAVQRAVDLSIATGRNSARVNPRGGQCRIGARVPVEHPLFAGYVLAANEVMKSACQKYPSRSVSLFRAPTQAERTRMPWLKDLIEVWSAVEAPAVASVLRVVLREGTPG